MIQEQKFKGSKWPISGLLAPVGLWSYEVRKETLLSGLSAKIAVESWGIYMHIESISGLQWFLRYVTPTCEITIYRFTIFHITTELHREGSKVPTDGLMRPRSHSSENWNSLRRRILAYLFCPLDQMCKQTYKWMMLWRKDLYILNY